MFIVLHTNKEVKSAFNGNIAETHWRTTFDNMTRSYGYSYDNLNRLTNAQFIRPINPTIYNPNPTVPVKDTFNESISYDKNGNIQSLQRNGGVESQTFAPFIDKLVYDYDPIDKNRLIKVTDNEPNTDGFKDGANNPIEYGYDNNGNMTRDDNKGIQKIVYNHLNLPTEITFDGINNKISYIYTATGQKVKKIVQEGVGSGTTDYMGGYQYNNNVLQFFPTAEGYVKHTAGVPNPYDYIFNYTDHLGNIRLSYGIDPANPSQIKKYEENNYYPFGLKHKDYNNALRTIVKAEPEELIPSGKKAAISIGKDPLAVVIPNSGYQYKYNGKELQEELGLNFYDYGARNYDPAIGRWINIDPIAEKYIDTSPYVYVKNSPVVYIDPDGQRIIFVNGYLGFGSPSGGAKYWGGANSGFVNGVKSYFNDKDAQFMDINHGIFSSASERQELGSEYAEENYESLTAGMDIEKDTFEFVTHSMGGAFGEGMISYLKSKGWRVSSAFHFNAFQAADMDVDSDETFVVDYQTSDDPVINNAFRSSPGKIKNATSNIGEKSKSKETSTKHREPIDNSKMMEEISTLISNDFDEKILNQKVQEILEKYKTKK